MFEWDGEKSDRWVQAEEVMHYGVPYLDDATRGLFPNDLVLFGAGTGVGKTQFATNVALKLSFEGKRVLFFALEADKHEIHRRMLYSTMRKFFLTYFKERGHSWPRFVDWLAMGYDRDWESLEAEARNELKLNTDSLKIFYKEGRYTAAQFQKDINTYAGDIDLIIVDHVHYFDLMQSNEFEGLKEVIHTLREISIKTTKPILALAHLRKNRDRFPDISDFHGHSDLVKVATNVIMASWAPKEKYEVGSEIYPTYLRVAKSRKAGEITSYVGLTTYNTLENKYAPKYVLCQNKVTGEDPEEVHQLEKIPFWAKNAKRPTSSFIGYRGNNGKGKDRED